MDFVNKLPNFLRWLLLPFASIIAWWLVNFLGQYAAKLIIFLSNPAGGWGENFFLYLLNPGISGYCAVYVAMLFAPSKRLYVAYISGFIWIAFSVAAGVLAAVTYSWPAVLACIATLVGCAIAIYDPLPDENRIEY